AACSTLGDHSSNRRVVAGPLVLVPSHGVVDLDGRVRVKGREHRWRPRVRRIHTSTSLHGADSSSPRWSWAIQLPTSAPVISPITSKLPIGSAGSVIGAAPRGALGS